MNMAPLESSPEYQQRMPAETEDDGDLLFLKKQMEALKLMDEQSINPEPIPDSQVFSNSDVFGTSAKSSHGSSNNLGSSTHTSSSKGNNDGSIDVAKYVGKFARKLTFQASAPSIPTSNIESGSMINQEMLKYNLTERNAIYEEVHGVGSLCPEENPLLIRDSLARLDLELKLLPAVQKESYEMSQRLLKTYVNEVDFRLRFLRANLFDPRKAARQMALFLDTARDIYGDYALERPIRLSDFTKKELKCMNLGRIQMLPYRDRGGRRIVVGIPNQNHKRHEPRTRTKIHLYLWWTASECVETQRKGMVFIIIHNPNVTDSTSTPNAIQSEDPANTDSDEDDESMQDVDGVPSMWFAKITQSIIKCLPVRLVAIHLCTPDTPFYNMMRSFNTVMFGDVRCRIKMHIGNDVENRYQLGGYGIPLDQLPITDSGKIKVNLFKKWLQFRKTIEDPIKRQNLDLKSIVECPRMNDVVFRPSQSTMCHPGNVMFRSLVESKHLEHSSAESRDAKSEITRGVIYEIQRQGGRFLVWNNSHWWKELTDEKQVYAKIAVFFRNSKASAKMKMQSIKSSTYMFARGGGNDSTQEFDKRRRIDDAAVATSAFQFINDNNDGFDSNACFGLI